MTAETWDYTELAPTYSLRPPYAPRAVNKIVEACGRRRPRVADIGAGTGHLTMNLTAHGCSVDAVEPNEAMRTIGKDRTAGDPAVRWTVGTGEHTGLTGEDYDLVTYGSSFNTTDRPAALREAARILRRPGWIACLWNHRCLDDPLQAEVEALIRDRVPGYTYGTRREDQTPVFEKSGLFGPPVKLEEPVRHRTPVGDWLAAWRSHATLQRQAGAAFTSVIDEIGALVARHDLETVEVPYTTVVWLARRREPVRS